MKHIWHDAGKYNLDKDQILVEAEKDFFHLMNKLIGFWIEKRAATGCSFCLLLV